MDDGAGADEVDEEAMALLRVDEDETETEVLVVANGAVDWYRLIVYESPHVEDELRTGRQDK